ncbi:hypothetical protein [Bacillus sp. ISL-77]|nr:hypothetical protein [Bacillus sp. ISL-77]MBT2744471.1 hypothetical protein [Bacillus sp. ISL-77]
MKQQQVTISPFPGRNCGVITVLMKREKQEGSVQLCFNLFKDNSSKE